MGIAWSGKFSEEGMHIAKFPERKWDFQHGDLAARRWSDRRCVGMQVAGGREWTRSACVLQTGKGKIAIHTAVDEEESRVRGLLGPGGRLADWCWVSALCTLTS